MRQPKRGVVRSGSKVTKFFRNFTSSVRVCPEAESDRKFRYK